jgi:hypothetical protein
MGITLVVALLLFVAAFVLGWKAGFWGWSYAPSWVPAAGVWGLSVIMLLRFVGDFRSVGVFKRDRGTRFARLDTLYFSPLCLALATLSAIVGFS